MSQGRVEDLIEKYQKGKLTSKEAYEELKKQGLVEHERWEFIPWVIYFLLLLLPTWAGALRLDFLQWFAELQRFYFPMPVIYSSVSYIEWRMMDVDVIPAQAGIQMEDTYSG